MIHYNGYASRLQGNRKNSDGGAEFPFATQKHCKNSDAQNFCVFRVRWALEEYTLAAQRQNQLQKAVDNRLVQEIDEQGLSSAPAEKAGNPRFLKRAGKKRLFFAVRGFPGGSSEQEIAKMREKREVVAGNKAFV